MFVKTSSYCFCLGRTNFLGQSPSSLLKQSMDNIIDKTVSEKIRYFLAALHNTTWALTACQKTIDRLFDCAQELEDIFAHDETYLSKNLLNLSLNKPVDILLENFIKNHNLNEDLTLYAIKKYSLLYSKDNFAKFLEKILSEVKLRKQIFSLIEESTDVELDFVKINNFLNDLLNTTDLRSRILNALKTKTSIFFKAIKHGEPLSSQLLMAELIHCLQSQTDLLVWFTIMKNENLCTVIDLCAMYNNFFCEVLKFFDTFADEIESNFDEELNIQYSHLNLDFENFLKVFQFFLLNSNLKNKISEYLDSKTVLDKNYCFWVDLKACL